MANRKKIYYPEDQIKQNLFTKGGEWMIEGDNTEWIGYYHSYTTGEVYTGKKWNDESSKPLVPFSVKEKSVSTYDILKLYKKKSDGTIVKMIGPNDFGQYHAPKAELVIPSQTDYNNGFIERHFVTKRNDFGWGAIEISSDQVENFPIDNIGINQYLYKLHKVLWKLTGPEYDQIHNGVVLTSGVVDTNLRSIQSIDSQQVQMLLPNPRQWTVYDVNK